MSTSQRRRNTKSLHMCQWRVCQARVSCLFPTPFPSNGGITLSTSMWEKDVKKNRKIIIVSAYWIKMLSFLLIEYSSNDLWFMFDRGIIGKLEYWWYFSVFGCKERFVVVDINCRYTMDIFIDGKLASRCQFRDSCYLFISASSWPLTLSRFRSKIKISQKSEMSKRIIVRRVLKNQESNLIFGSQKDALRGLLDALFKMLMQWGISGNATRYRRWHNSAEINLKSMLVLTRIDPYAPFGLNRSVWHIYL